jgi:DNA polymerase V
VIRPRLLAPVLLAPVLSAAVLKERERASYATPLSDINISDMLVPHPEKTFVVRVNGDSMIKRNIFDGDLLLVERETKPRDGQIVVAAVNGEMAVKTYKTIDGKAYLFAENDRFLPLEISGFWSFEVQGVVRHVIRGV